MKNKSIFVRLFWLMATFGLAYLFYLAAEAMFGERSAFFHLDAYFIFLLMAMLLIAIVKFAVRRVSEFLKHLSWMKHKSGGSFVTDPEAIYWLRLINDPRWKPIWRWYFDAEWEKKYGKNKSNIHNTKEDGDKPESEKEKRRKKFHKRVRVTSSVVSVVLALGIVLLLLGPSVIPKIHVDVEPVLMWNLSPTGNLGNKFQRTDTANGIMEIILSVSRTDGMSGEADVVVTVSSSYILVLTGLTGGIYVPALDGVGFANVDEESMTVYGLVFYQNSTTQTYAETLRIQNRGHALVYIFMVLREELVVSPCGELAFMAFTGTPAKYTITEAGC